MVAQVVRELVWVGTQGYARRLKNPLYLCSVFQNNMYHHTKNDTNRIKSQLLLQSQNPAVRPFPLFNHACLKVNTVISKVNRAKAQSRPSGILFAQANGKLYFEFLKRISGTQNHLPHKGNVTNIIK